MRRTRYVRICVLAIGLVQTVLNARSHVDPVNKSGSGVALKGYDPVAYFTESKPVNGSQQFEYEWMGAKWWFASATDRDRFASKPEQYAPQFGGYCAWAVSNNYTADGDPEAWKIVDGKLYVNYNKSVQNKWEQDLNKRIDDAVRNWPSLHR
jgi:YHS domain-containing protein